MCIQNDATSISRVSRYSKRHTGFWPRIHNVIKCTLNSYMRSSSSHTRIFNEKNGICSRAMQWKVRKMRMKCQLVDKRASEWDSYIEYSKVFHITRSQKYIYTHRHRHSITRSRLHLYNSNDIYIHTHKSTENRELTVKHKNRRIESRTENTIYTCKHSYMYIHIIHSFTYTSIRLPIWWRKIAHTLRWKKHTRTSSERVRQNEER